MYDNSKVDYNRINVSLSQKLGSKIYGVGNPNPSGYGRDVKELKKEYGFFEIKFGMNSDVVIETTSIFKTFLMNLIIFFVLRVVD